MPESLFTRDGEYFLPTVLAGSPWNPEVLHGGAPAGLLGHAMAAVGDPAMPLVRFTMDLLGPVPSAPLAVHAEPLRAGRRMQVLGGSLTADGVEVCRATALRFEQADMDVPPYARFPGDTLPPCGDRPIGSLAEVAGWSGEFVPRGLHTTVEVCRLDGVAGRGFGRVWMRLPVSVVAGEPVSPTVQATALSDFGNGVGQLVVAERTGCINADVTLYLHRTPEPGWLGLEARQYMASTGAGRVETGLYDVRGPLGRVVQTTMAMTMHGGGSAESGG